MYNGEDGQGLYQTETLLRDQWSDVLKILLLDQTRSDYEGKSHNIIWANNHYQRFGLTGYTEKSEIKSESLTQELKAIVKPRAFKEQELQKARTRQNAEVFTPLWIIKKQNDAVDESFQSDDLETYVKRTWLEITCGEGPYITSRYDAATGQKVALEDRVGFLDRKLNRISQEVDDKAEWQRLVEWAYKSSYGFEWNGDSLLLARENLLYTYRDYSLHKWGKEPSLGLLKKIATLISYNVFQMDGLTYTLPLSETKEEKSVIQLSLFDDEPEIEWEILPGIPVKIMNWETNEFDYFDKELQTDD